MFGYVMANLPELDQALQKRYSAVYCGICRQIRQRSSNLARQKSRAGHLSHRGAPLGRQTVAPSSMSAWLNCPGACRGMISASAAV